MTGREDFGTALRRLRLAKGLSQTELSTRVHSSQGAISKLESGKRDHRIDLVLRCDEVLDAGGELVAAHARLLERPADHRLPPGDGYFTGRSREIGLVQAALAGGHRICTISGMGGVGKTALAHQCARLLAGTYPDGIYHLRLGPHQGTMAGYGDDASAVSEALSIALRQFGLSEAEIPAQIAAQEIRYRSWLHEHDALIVLDDVSKAWQVRALLPTGSRSAVLVTSRRRLSALDEAELLDLDPLDESTAMELFCRVARIDSESGAQQQALRRVVRACGMLPLGVRIAAAKLRTGSPFWTVEVLDRRLAADGRRLSELTDGERSLTSVFELSLRTLAEPQTRLFLLLGEVPGRDFDAFAAAVLHGVDGAEADRLLFALREAHLIEQVSAERYRLHDLLKEFAAQEGGRRIPEAERLDALTRLIKAMTHTALRADKVLNPHRFRPEFGHAPDIPAQPDWEDSTSALAWFDEEYGNLVALCRTAYRLQLFEHCWQLAFSLRSYLFQMKLFDIWLDTHRWALAAARACADHVAVKLTLANLATAHLERGDLDEAQQHYREAMSLALDQQDERGVTTLLAHLGWVALYRGELEVAAEELTRAARRYTEQGNVRNSAISERGLALARSGLGDHGSAIETARRVVAVATESGLELDVAMASNCLGWICYCASRMDDARAAYQDALAYAELCGSDYETARANLGLGNVATACEDMAEAEHFWSLADARWPDPDPRMLLEAAARHVPGTHPR